MSTKSTQHRTDRRRPTVVLAFILLVTLQTALRGSAVPAPTRPRTSNSASDRDGRGVDDAIAMEQLTRVFGVSHLSDYYGQRRRHFDDDDDDHTRQSTTRYGVRHRSPPDYMVQLYDTIAYTDGISKTAAPYEADVVRGIPDRGRHFFHIDVKRTILFYNKKPS